MPLREFGLGHVALAALAFEFSERDLPRMINEKREQLETCCPVIRRLRAAYLTHTLMPRREGLFLRFFLREREKNHCGIPLHDGVPVPKDGDAFRIEVQAVRQTLDAVRLNIGLVTDPALPLDELISDTVSSAERRALRKLLATRRGKQIDLPGFSENPIHVPVVPRTLPVGTSLMVTAEMGDFSREEVILENIRRIDGSGAEIVDPKIGSSIPLKRDAYGPIAAYNALLIAAKDLGVRARLEVVVVRDWAHASPIAFHLVRAHPLFGPHLEIKGP